MKTAKTVKEQVVTVRTGLPHVGDFNRHRQGSLKIDRGHQQRKDRELGSDDTDDDRSQLPRGHGWVVDHVMLHLNILSVGV